MREEYMLTRDIDWFAKIGPYYMHFASNGSILPVEISRNQLEATQNRVAEIPEEGEQHINERHLGTLLRRGAIGEGFQERYLESFRIFAAKGFYSFDYDRIEGRYVLVAMPGQGNRYDRLAEIQCPTLDGEQEWEQDCIAQIREFR